MKSKPNYVSAKGPKGAEEHLRIWLSRPGSQHCEHIRPTHISDAVKEPNTLLWVDLRDPGPDQIKLLREEFGFHRLALEDVVKQRQRPKIDEYPGYFFVVMYAPLPNGSADTLETVELHLFVGKNYVVTAHRGEIPALNEAMVRWERTDAELRDQVGFLVHVISDSVIDAFFPVVEALEERLDQIEVAMFGSNVQYNAEEVLAIKRTLYTLRKAIYPLREVFNVFLRRDHAIFGAETYPYFQDVYDHILRLLDTVDIERDMATGALEAQLSIVSNRLNETMKRLTLVAICVAVIGAVFGAWGMNFDEVPLHGMGQLGFYFVSGGAVVLVLLALYLARRFNQW